MLNVLHISLLIRIIVVIFDFVVEVGISFIVYPYNAVLLIILRLEDFTYLQVLEVDIVTRS